MEIGGYGCGGQLGPVMSHGVGCGCVVESHSYIPNQASMVFFWGFNQLVAAVSANRDRPNLGFESDNVWQWWEDRLLGFEINDVRF